MIGERLKKLRGNRTQEDIAKFVGVSRARYSHYENGRSEPDYEILEKLADFYNCTTDFLLGRSEHPTETEDEFLERMISEGTLAFNDYEGLSEDDIQMVKDEIKKEMKKQVEYMVWRKMQEKKK